MKDKPVNGTWSPRTLYLSTLSMSARSALVGFNRAQHSGLGPTYMMHQMAWVYHTTNRAYHQLPASPSAAVAALTLFADCSTSGDISDDDPKWRDIGRDPWNCDIDRKQDIDVDTHICGTPSYAPDEYIVRQAWNHSSFREALGPILPALLYGVGRQLLDPNAPLG